MGVGLGQEGCVELGRTSHDCGVVVFRLQEIKEKIALVRMAVLLRTSAFLEGGSVSVL
jgi:hypothetical protein